MNFVDVLGVYCRRLNCANGRLMRRTGYGEVSDSRGDPRSHTHTHTRFWTHTHTRARTQLTICWRRIYVYEECARVLARMGEITLFVAHTVTVRYYKKKVLCNWLHTR